MTAQMEAHTKTCDRPYRYHVHATGDGKATGLLGASTTLKSAEHLAQRLADSYGEPVHLLPCLLCSALIPEGTYYPR